MEFSGQYLTYDEYEDLGGTLAEMPFNLLEFEARQNIDKYTFGRLKNLDKQNEDVKLCVYQLIGIINGYDMQETQNKGVSSENTDGYSISYNTPTKSITDAKTTQIKSVIRDYLIDNITEDKTPVLYVGADV